MRTAPKRDDDLRTMFSKQAAVNFSDEGRSATNHVNGAVAPTTVTAPGCEAVAPIVVSDSETDLDF